MGGVAGGVVATREPAEDGEITPFQLSTVGSTEYTDVHCDASNNIGGGVVMPTWPTRGSVICDKNTNERTIGRYLSGLGTGGMNINVFNVAVAQYDFVFVELIVSGIVQGVAGGGGVERWMVRNDGGSMSAVQIDANRAPSGTALYNSGANPSALDPNTHFGNVTFTIYLAPTAAGSALDVQIKTRGGKHALAQA